MQPHSSERSIVSPADLAACRQMIRDGSKTFYMASLLLPERVRDPARSLYAFCRVADDAVDKSGDCARAVDELLTRLDNIYRGQPAPQPADRAFADVVERFALPRALPAALIEGFAWDAEGRRYETLPQLTAYAVRVAGTVGVMMSLIMGVRHTAAIARACDLGVAMQLTNIVRDVGEDARNGRLYLPHDLMIAAGLDPQAWLADPRSSPSLKRVLAQLLAEADRLYRRAALGIALLPSSCRPAIHAARVLYAEIGREVERQHFESVNQRAVVSSRRKLQLMASAIAASYPRSAGDDAPPLEEAQFICEAVSAAMQPQPVPRGLHEKTAWVIALFMRLEGQKQ